jgi:hypothetical protein
MAVMDRLHPDRRRGAWPRLLTSRKVFAYEATVHALFGVVLGLARSQSSSSSRSSRSSS